MQATKKIYNLQSLSFLRSAGNLKIGIMGGSFYPAHIGHLAISHIAIKKYKFDYIIWLVANQNPLKAPYKFNIFARAKQANLVVDHPRILVSTAEYDLATYQTFDSLQKITGMFKNINFTWMMGIDNLEHFHKWQHSQKITKLCNIIVFDRPFRNRLVNNNLFEVKFKAELAKNQSNNIMIDRNCLIAISSTAIRRTNFEYS